VVAAKYDIKVEQGGTFELTVDVRRNGAAVSNMDAGHVQIRPFRRSEEDYYDATHLNDLVLFNGQSQVQWKIPAETTADFDWYDGAEYDVTVTLTTGDIHRIAEGRVYLSPSVTRS
jgi:hypothetical protein